MTDKLKVVGHDDLVRDTRSGAILNTNQTEFEQFVNRRKQELANEQRVVELEARIARLESLLTGVLNTTNRLDIYG